MRWTLTLALVATVVAAHPTAGQEAAGSPAERPLSIASVTVEPANPGPDTLCRLRIRLRNAGDRKASQLAFRVRINGQPLPVYDNQIFMQAIPPDATTEVALYNFWSTETGRPAPADGKLAVEVVLTEAKWYEIGMEGEVEVWKPLEDVPGLPVEGAVTLAMGGGKAP